MSDTGGVAAGSKGVGARRVLVVDDDELILEVAQMCLEAVGGWQVTTASSGQEGLDRAVSERPDAIVMDVMMPGMDGPATAVALHENPVTTGIPIVLLTAKAQGKGQTDLSTLPIIGVLSKPFDPMLLPATLSSMLGWS